jgi:2-keto-4-pentenoate hydratase/2-oxohepta-3-ene-1,7-dioic acid hydratase in catechol pathway
MQIISFRHDNNDSYGLHRDGEIVDAGSRLEYPDLRALLAAGDFAALSALESKPADYRVDDIAFLPVVPNAPRIFCVGANYFEHMKEAGREPPETPYIFLRNNASLVGHRQPMLKPLESDSYDWEVELCAVVGTSGRRIAHSDALDHVAGFTVFNDGSVRDYQRMTPMWIPGKNFDRSAAVGPWMVPKDEFDTSFEVKMQSRLNGETMQSDIVNRWHFSLQDVIAWISSWTALQPGDLITMGTPSGVGFARTPPLFMKPGDEIEVEIEGIGVLANRIEQG